jgi:hypothetical protein
MRSPSTSEALPKVFLLSPANCGGRRAGFLLRPEGASPLAQRLRVGTLTLGEAFSFMSGLYFRGKLSYARTFARPSAGGGAADDDASYVITPTRGLQRPEMPVSRDILQEFASTDIAAGELRYREPLERDIAALAARLSAATTVVLLGSIATGKYADVLAPALGRRLHYPSSFVGRGDMSRGGLLLRSASSGVELEYLPFDPHAARRGKRPPRLTPARALRSAVS